MSDNRETILRDLKLVRNENPFPPGSEIIAGAYLRQSTIDGQNSEGVKEQLEFIHHRIKSDQVRSILFPQCKITLPDDLVFVDHGKTGRVEAHREKYSQFKQAIQLGRIQLGLVFDFSRLTRELGSLLDVYDLAQMHRVELISVSELVSSHSEGARNHFMFKGMVNELQSESTSRQTRRGLELRAIAGKSTGNLPYGFKSVAEDPNRERLPNEPANRLVVIDEEKAPIIRRIFDLYATTNIGIDGIARLLNQEKIPSAKNTLWIGRVIYGILKQHKYIGVWIHGKTQIARDSSRKKLLGRDRLIQVPRPSKQWVVKEWPERQIVSKQVWDQVQERLVRIEGEKKNSPNRSVSLWGRSRGQANHFFTGTMACGECGGNFIVMSGRRGGYLGCHNAYRKKTCSNKKTARLGWVEGSLLKLLREWFDDPKTLDIITSRCNKKIEAHHDLKHNKTTALESELSKVEKTIAHFVQYLAEGNASDAVKEGLRRSEERKKVIEAQIMGLKIKQPAMLLMTPHAIREFLVNLDEILALDVARANAYFKGIFPQPIKMTVKQNERSYCYEATGEVDIKKLVRREYSVPVNGVPKGI